MLLLYCIVICILILVMSGSVHPNSGPMFPCSVCAGNVTWKGRLVQCCTCSRQLTLLYLSSLLHLLLLGCPIVLCCDFLFGTPACIPQLFSMTHLPLSTNKAPPSHSHLQTYVSGCFSKPSSSSSPNLLRFFSGMLEVFEPEVLYFFTLSHFIL